MWSTLGPLTTAVEVPGGVLQKPSQELCSLSMNSLLLHPLPEPALDSMAEPYVYIATVYKTIINSMAK